MSRVAANLPARLSSSLEEITMEPDGLQTFIDDVGLVVSSTDDEYEITKRVAERLSDLLAGGYRLPPEVTRPSPVHHVTYPLYIAPDDSWSMASVVWDVGQRTPVHSHETWGVVGIYSGIEREARSDELDHPPDLTPLARLPPPRLPTRDDPARLRQGPGRPTHVNAGRA